jgi:hypothetical protein
MFRTRMQHFTMSQYFNRINIALMMLLLIPIFGFIAVYTLIATGGSQLIVQWLAMHHLVTITATVWLLLLLFFFKRIKSIRNDQGLGLKLQKYFRLTIVRYILISMLSVFLAISFYITKDDRVTAIFASNLIFAAIVWPRPAKACNDLKLRGDERELVYFKKDTF